MSLNKRLNKNVTVSKFLNLIKEADGGEKLKPFEYVQLEQLMSENLTKNDFLSKFINKLNNDSMSFTLQELERYNTIKADESIEDETDYDSKIAQLQGHLNLIKMQKETLEVELIKLNDYEIDDELSKELGELNELGGELNRLFEELQPLLVKRTDSQDVPKLVDQLMNTLNKLKTKRLDIDRLIEEVMMRVDLSLNADKLVKIVEREYYLKLIKIKNLLESLRNESEKLMKNYRNLMNNSTIWKKYLKEFQEGINNEENLISCGDQKKDTSNSNQTNSAFNYDDFKEYLKLSENDPVDELILKVKNEIEKVNN